ncbi:MAG: YfcE family phosphodiesterase [Clostridiales bacterium]|nr:YfcE family phosphodiesterase [Clostridiales bacterium]
MIREIGIFSDSHGQVENLYKAVKAAEKHGAEGFLFLGDGVGDFAKVMKELPGKFAWAVRGNGDYFLSDTPKERVLPFGDTQIYAVHGHLYQVKITKRPLMAAAQKRNCLIACYGHTHTAAIEEREGILLFNPGAISSYGEKIPFGLLRVNQGTVVPLLMETE